MHRSTAKSEFKFVMSNTKWSDDLYRFLQVVYHLYPESAFHELIETMTAKFDSDQEIYTAIQRDLPKIKPFLSDLRLALPALRRQKKEMTRQTLEVLSPSRDINGYVEIGSTGRYVSDLRHHVKLSGKLWTCNDVPPTNSVADIAERGQIGKIGQFINLDYKPFDERVIPSGSVDLVTCFIGLHHCPLDSIAPFIQSIRRILRPGGQFIMREHDVNSADMAAFVSLVHTVFNLGLMVPCAVNDNELKVFRSADEWSGLIVENGFVDGGFRILQHKDPSLNTLMTFTKAQS